MVQRNTYSVYFLRSLLLVLFFVFAFAPQAFSAENRSKRSVQQDKKTFLTPKKQARRSARPKNEKAKTQEAQNTRELLKDVPNEDKPAFLPLIQQDPDGKGPGPHW
ncbi:MAG: hypothetical protein J5803_05045 [Desulfovibrio sp.]|nr:hypothetical protein [Desulfovibrio sp.]